MQALQLHLVPPLIALPHPPLPEVGGESTESYNRAQSFLGSAAPQDPMHHAQPQRCPSPLPALLPLQTKQGQLLVEHGEKKI